MTFSIRMTPRRAEVLKAIRHASQDGARTVTEDQWREAYYAMTPAAGDNKRQSFRRSAKLLVQQGVVREVDYFEFALIPRDKRDGGGQSSGSK